MNVVRLCREKIRRSKTQLELNMVTAVKGDIKGFYKYNCNTRRAKEHLCPLVNISRNIIAKDMDKVMAPNISVFSFFKSKTKCYQDTWALS